MGVAQSGKLSCTRTGLVNYEVIVNKYSFINFRQFVNFYFSYMKKSTRLHLIVEAALLQL